jgi:hypothetical protein
MQRLITSTFAATSLICLAAGCRTASPTAMNNLQPLLESRPALFSQAMSNAPELRLQILVSEVVTVNGRPSLKRHGYRLGAEYFYPASTVKLCGAVAALQELERLQARHGCGDLVNARLEIAPLFPGDLPQTNDVTNLQTGHITVGHENRKIALVSDNQAFNQLFDLVGHEQLNRSMHALGLRSTVINHRLSEPRTIPNPLASAEARIFPGDSAPIIVPARVSELKLTNNAPGLSVGRGVLRGDTVVNEPMNFSARNGISITDLQDLLVKVVRPDIDLGTPSLRLSPQHRAELLSAMTEYPRESTNPVYAEKNYPDNYSKFLLPGVRRIFPDIRPATRIESTGKIGRAYGFSIENSYLHNPANGRSVFVTACLYTNADGILNDDKYEYATVADVFLENLGELVATEWLSGSR